MNEGGEQAGVLTKREVHWATMTNKASGNTPAQPTDGEAVKRGGLGS